MALLNGGSNPERVAVAPTLDQARASEKTGDDDEEGPTPVRHRATPSIGRTGVARNDLRSSPSRTTEGDGRSLGERHAVVAALSDNPIVCRSRDRRQLANTSAFTANARRPSPRVARRRCCGGHGHSSANTLYIRMSAAAKPGMTVKIWMYFQTRVPRISSLRICSTKSLIAFAVSAGRSLMARLKRS